MNFMNKFFGTERQEEQLPEVSKPKRNFIRRKKDLTTVGRTYYKAYPPVTQTKPTTDNVDKEEEPKENVKVKKTQSKTTSPQETNKKDVDGKVEEKVKEAEEEAEKVKKEKSKPVIVKPIKDITLSILVIENTSFVASMVNGKVLEKYLNKVSPDNLLCVIQVSDEILLSPIKFSNKFKLNEIKCDEKRNTGVNLYRAFRRLEEIIENKKLKTFEFDKFNANVTKYEIMYIGTCNATLYENYSDLAVRIINRVLNNSNVEGKCLCINDSQFVNAAKFGFRSISSVSREY